MSTAKPLMPIPERSDERFALLREDKAAELLCVSVRTLQAWRLRGFGPAFVRVGRAVRYRREDLMDWIAANRVQPNGTIA